LESNIVFLPDTCKLPSARKDPNTHWDNSEDDDAFVLWRASKEVEEKLSSELHKASRLAIEQENRRLLYVAMTRARERLYVCGWEGKKGRKDGCWYDLISPIFEEEGEKVSLDTGENLWRIETPQIVLQNEDKVATKKLAAVNPLPQWAITSAPSEPLPARPLAPSRPTEENPPTMSPINDGDANFFQRGLLIHRLLQSLPDVPPKDRRAKGNDFLKRPSLNLTPEAREEILSETLAVINHPDHATLFGPSSLTEVPIAGVLGLGDNSTVVSGQIDRLLVTRNFVTIIDYKTNRLPPENENAVSKIYLRQMAAYRDLLKSVYPDRPVHTFLLWTVGPKIMALSDQILDVYTS
jgi:ATP-dependent helicase/nuclease subunit A